MMVRQRASGSWELRVKHKLLPHGAYFSTFDDETRARDYGMQLERMLKAGLVPAELLAARDSSAAPVPTLGAIIREYLNTQTTKAWIDQQLELVFGEHGAVRLDEALSYRWAEAFVASYKKRQLVPGSIRKRVGAMAACLDWQLKRTESEAANALRLLPRGYSAYSVADRKAVGITRDVDVPADMRRDRRLAAGEEQRIRRAMAGDMHHDIVPGAPPRERALDLEHRPALELMLDLVLETGMRLSEIYTLTVDQVQLERNTIALDRTKNGDGRQVPLSSPAIAALKRYLQAPRVGLLFPWFVPPGPGVDDVDQYLQRERRRVTSLLSGQWSRIFDYAGVADLSFHDLRHELTCRLYERTKLTDVQIARILGWRDPRMGIRYASLRGSDLAAAMW
jgi:integrase